MSNDTKVFWLHVKKAGGTSMREMFKDFYALQPDRYSYPNTFIALPKEQWNDALNNYRIPLGKYDYRRMLFAKEFLYDEVEFREMYKFVVVRNPYDRIVSAWKYLFRKRFYDLEYLRMKYSFKYFLRRLPDYMEKRFKQLYHLGYVGLHAAPVWQDITGEDGELLVDKIVRLEDFDDDIRELNDLLGLDITLSARRNVSERSKNYASYYDTKSRELVEELYAEDISNLGYTF